MFTPSPKRSPARIITSPMWIPMRKLMCLSGGTSVFASASAACASTAHSTASAALPPELRKDTIARRVRYAAPVFPNEPVEDGAAFGETLERADLVSAHEAAVALDICCEDCDEASADFRR